MYCSIKWGLIMKVIRKVEYWGYVHHAKWLDYLRIILGLIIFANDVSFISANSILQNLITQNNIFGFSSVLISVAIYVAAFALLDGGILIALGLVTRFAVLIPILVYAIFFVNLNQVFHSQIRNFGFQFW